MPLSSRDLADYGRAARAAVVVLYVAGVIWGFSVLNGEQLQPGQIKYIATRDLPSGHRLHAGDFVFDPSLPAGERMLLPAWLDPTGEYVTHSHTTNQPIEQSDLTAAPIIKVGKDDKGKDLLVYWFFLDKQPRLVPLLNAETRVDICNGRCIAENVRVLSVTCNGAPGGPDCYAALEVSADIDAKLASGAKDYRLILRGNSTR